MEPNRTESNSQYQPRPGTLLAALQNVPGANINIGGRIRPVAEVLAEREAEARKAEAEKRAFAEKRAADARRQAEADAANAARVQAEADARRADQAIVDAANAAAAAAYDHDTIVLKIRHDKQIGSSARIIRCYWRRGDAKDMLLAPAHIQDSIAGCTCEKAAAEIVAKRVISNGFKIRAFYHDSGLRELALESGPQNSLPKPGEGRGGVEQTQTAQAAAAPDTVVMHGHTYRLGAPACPTTALYRVDYYPGGIPPRGVLIPRVYHVKQLVLVNRPCPGNPPTGPDDAYITSWGRAIRHNDFEVER